MSDNPYKGLEHIVRTNESLAPYTSLGIGGPTEFFAEPTNPEELASLIEITAKLDRPARLLGLGTNLLVKDEGNPGMVIHLSAPDFAELKVDGNVVTCGGGCRLSNFLSLTAREGFVGPEQLAGIPGTVGGALHGNSDANGCDIGQWVRSATVVTRDGQVKVHQKDELNFSYRSSSLSELVILSAEFEFERGDASAVSHELQKHWILKKNSQPVSGQKTAYIFKDPGGLSADSLIDQAGLKGTKVGQVEIFQQNANFFVAHPGATYADVMKLIDVCKTKVSAQFGIDLETGINIW